MGSPIFRKVVNTGKSFGKIMNSQPVSTISKDLIAGGNIANKVLNNPIVQSAAVASGPEGMALYGAAKVGANTAIQTGQGIQRAKGVVNASPFKPTYAQ
jgi:hypothetical protein